MLTRNYTVASSYGNTTSYWAINKYTDTANAWLVNRNGFTGQIPVEVAFAVGVRPVITVRNDLDITSGTGTWNNPYQI